MSDPLRACTLLEFKVLTLSEEFKARADLERSFALDSLTDFEPGTLNFRARYSCRWTLKNATS